MKNHSLSIFGLALSCLMTVLPAHAQQPVAAIPEKDSVLIVYLSRTKNTEAVAHMIQGFTGGQMVAVEPEKPYPKDYPAIVQQVDRENETGFLPPLKTKIDNIGSYHTIFIGFPTWDMALPPPMKSFLKSHNLEGKTVVPFNTNAGYGVGSGFETVKDLCPKSKVLEGFSVKGGIERDGVLFVMEEAKADETKKQIGGWLEKIGIPASR